MSTPSRKKKLSPPKYLFDSDPDKSLMNENCQLKAEIEDLHNMFAECITEHKKEMVDILLDQINTNDHRLISTIAICRDSLLLMMRAPI